MNTYKIDKQTAKDICAIRKAQHTIDKIELSNSDEWKYRRGGFKPPDSPDVAYLQNGTLMPPFRCDIIARWTAIAERQQYAGVMQPDTTIFLSYADNGEVTLRCGQSSVRLYPIEQGNEPPIHPLPIVIENDTIKLAIDPKEITDKAKLLTSNAARIKKEREQAAKSKAEQAKQAEYERCKAIVTPEAIRHCVKRVKRLRKLSVWLRNVSKELDQVPSLPQLIANPLFNAFNPEYSEAYGDARLQHLEAVRKRDNFKPRSWRSKGLEKHNENVRLALRRVRETALSALDNHIQTTGFYVHNGSNPISASDDRKYNANDVRRCRGYIRDYEREHPEAIQHDISEANL